MPPHGDLAAFLRSRRARLQPEDVGLPAFGRRRVPGLRREELAQLAGVSVAYYTRIEQGQSANVSPDVLDAIARALRLDGDERAHLHGLVQRRPATRRPAAQSERVRDGLAGLVLALDHVPAAIVGRRMDILVWNPLLHALLAGHLPFTAPASADPPNWARLMFLDSRLQELFVDWELKAQDVVGYLRVQAGRYPDDDGLAALIGELSMKSPQFARLWSSYVVRDKSHGRVRFQHPVVGSFELLNETLRLPDAPDFMVATFHAEAGSPAEASLRMLATLTAASAPDEQPEARPADGTRPLKREP